MRKMVLCVAICSLLPATMLMAGDTVVHLNVKTGLWETISTTIANGSMGIPPELASQLIPEQRAKYEAAMQEMGNGKPRSTTYKDCLTQKQLDENPFSDKSRDDELKCKDTVIRSTASDLEIKESCTEESSKADVHITFHASSPEHVTGTGTIVATVGGRTMNSNIKMESKWLGTTCPVSMKQ
ncbi:MAG TPA: DUF3617 domain-containing protein [Candidatus Dormibacteraeota bacterium]|nr:DUF3617 domain-containing protein [Candidatus Dormibacteraeota bacterium]